jgi:predicted nucleic acid-binding Zn ribbon protein
MEHKKLSTIRKCTICGKDFHPVVTSINQNTCSYKCREEKNRERSRNYAREKRMKTPLGKCFVCGYDKAIDIHHERGREYKLCPNCHARITRGYSTLEELLKEHNRG